MKMKLSMLFAFIAIGIFDIEASTLFPDSRTATNAVELGVEGIARLCPTGLWDHRTFRDIVYDKESNTVVFVIQLNRWNEIGKEVTAEEAKKQTEWIVENIMEGYNELTESPRIMCDGDSTGAVAGNILGATLGFKAIPEKYTETIQLKNLI